MTTELQKMYVKARVTSRGHYAAIRKLAGQVGVDADTIVRCLDRARQADAIDARKKRRKGATA